MGTRVAAMPFEELVITLTSATQVTFKNYMDSDLLAGRAEKKVGPLDSDLAGIVSITGDYAGFVIITTDKTSAGRIAGKLLMVENPGEAYIRDALGELANTVAGVFKTRFEEQYGSVALGLPLVVSGRLQTIPGLSDAVASSSLNLQVTIPFSTIDGAIAITVMAYM